jgi:hypothetical protein
MRCAGDGSPMQRGDVMNAMNVRCIPIMLAMCSLGTVTAVASAQGDAHVGTWELDLARSTFSPGPAPRRQTLTYRAEGQGSTAVLLLQGVGPPHAECELRRKRLEPHQRRQVRGHPQESRKGRPDLHPRCFERWQDDDHHDERRRRERALDQQRQGLRQAGGRSQVPRRCRQHRLRRGPLRLRPRLIHLAI